MAKFKKLSADEAQNRRKDHLRQVGPVKNAIVKASKSPASWDDKKRTARFVMSTEGKDRYGDIVVTDGIDTAEFERNPVGLLFHSSRDWPIGTWDNLVKELNRRPPRLEGDLVLLAAGGPIATIDEAAWMIANGGIRACSIGFQPNWETVELLDEEDWFGGLKFNESVLLECSVCAIPANAQALVRSADGDPRLARELVEDVLDNWARSPEGLMLPRAAFEAMYQTLPQSNAVTAVKAKKADDDLEMLALVLGYAKPDSTIEIEQHVEKTGVKEGFTTYAATDHLLVKVSTNGLTHSTAVKHGQKQVAEMIVAKLKEIRPKAEIPKPLTDNGVTFDKIVMLPPADAPTAKEVDAPTTKDVSVGTMSVGMEIQVDTDEATKKVSAFDRLLDGVATKWSKLFGGRAQDAPDPVAATAAVEATIASADAAAKAVIAKPVPTAEEMAASKKRGLEALSKASPLVAAAG